MRAGALHATTSHGGATAPPSTEGWTLIQARTGVLRGLDLRELWAFREIGIVLALTSLRVRYKQTALGVLWVLAGPLSTVVVFSAVFGGLAKLPSEGVPYPVFVYSGLLVWQYISGSIGAATASLVGARDLVTKLYFPRLLAPLSATAPRLVDLGIGLVVMAVLLAVYGVAPGPALVLLPVWIVAAAAVSLAVGLITSALNVRYRDVGYAVPLVLQLWLFASPVIFPSSAVTGGTRVALALNPVTGVLDGMRWSLIDGPPPPGIDLLSFAVAAVLLVAGLLYFQRVERGFADVI